MNIWNIEYRDWNIWSLIMRNNKGQVMIENVINVTCLHLASFENFCVPIFKRFAPCACAVSKNMVLILSCPRRNVNRIYHLSCESSNQSCFSIIFDNDLIEPNIYYI